jgi:hypothetical protein
VGELDELPPPEDLRIASSENESRLGPVPGTVKWWKPEKGYGVVLTPETAPKEIWVSFMHIEGEGFGNSCKARRSTSSTNPPCRTASGSALSG